MSLLRASRLPGGAAGASRRWEQWFLPLGLAPLLAGTACLVFAVPLFNAHGTFTVSGVLGRSAMWGLVMPLLALVLSAAVHPLVFPGRPRRTSLLVDVFAVSLAGAVVTFIYAGMLAKWAPSLLRPEARPFHLYEILGPGLVLGPLLLGKMLFIAFSSPAEEWWKQRLSDQGDADREWWARWIRLDPDRQRRLDLRQQPGLLRPLAGRRGGRPGQRPAGGRRARRPHQLARPQRGVRLQQRVRQAERLAHVGSGARRAGVLRRAAAAGVGRHAGPARPALPAGQETAEPGRRRGGRARRPAVAPRPGRGGRRLGATTDVPPSASPGWITARATTPPFLGSLWTSLTAIAALFGLGNVMGYFVNVNRFSLQGMYRNRLIRAYLGASNSRRRPNPFTGFDWRDNLRMHALRDQPAAARRRAWPSTWWRARTSPGSSARPSSFTATPLHCGTRRPGLPPLAGLRRPQRHLAGHRGRDLGRRGQPQHGPLLVARPVDLHHDAVQRPAGGLARQPRQARAATTCQPQRPALLEPRDLRGGAGA